jgi:RNA polymerase sigma factor (sigma-70 family)
MDTPIPSTVCARPSSWFDETLVQISTIALESARTCCRLDVAQDIAQDVVLGFVEKFDAGRLSEPPTYLEALVKRMVRQRIIDRGRRDVTRARYEADFAECVKDSHHVWMQPDSVLEARELDELQTQILDELHPSCRRAFALVREDDHTYKLAGDELGLTPLAICQHVVFAPQAVRDRLTSEGVAVPQPRRARTTRATTNRTRR